MSNFLVAQTSIHLIGKTVFENFRIIFVDFFPLNLLAIQYSFDLGQWESWDYERWRGFQICWIWGIWWVHWFPRILGWMYKWLGRSICQLDWCVWKVEKRKEDVPKLLGSIESSEGTNFSFLSIFLLVGLELPTSPSTFPLKEDLS